MITKPQFAVASLANGLAWQPDPAFRFEEKIDGVWHCRDNGGALLVGELVSAPCSAPPPGFKPSKIEKFYVFDILRRGGEDLRSWPLSERLEVLDGITAERGLLRPAVGSGGSFLESVLERGGEGVVCKPLDGAWGVPWLKCKRAQTVYARILELDGAHGSAVVGYDPEMPGHTPGFKPSKNGGRVALRSKFDLVRVGSVLKLECYGLTREGKLREARLDKDTPQSWLKEF